jgi:SAM-dependent methyltransferase
VVVLDVGCGSGATTLGAAARAGRVVGVDLSRPLVELARRRAQAAGIGNAEFVIADAQSYDFTAATFDLLISQFGLMFFDDPVRAFTNIRGSLRVGGRAAFVSWQGLLANEWLTLIGDAVSRHVELPEFGGQDRGPGMFALSEPDEITALLAAAGFNRVECDSYTPTIILGGGGSLDDSVALLLGMGMSRGLIGLVDPSAQDEVLRTVHAELVDRYEEGVGIRLGAAAWVVTAQA